MKLGPMLAVPTRTRELAPKLGDRPGWEPGAGDEDTVSVLLQIPANPLRNSINSSDGGPANLNSSRRGWTSNARVRASAERQHDCGA